MRPVGAGRHRLLLCLPFAVMALVAAADVLAGPQVGLLALFSLGPGFAAVAGSARRAPAVGVLAGTLCASASVYDGLDGTRREAAALTAVVGATGAAVLAGVARRRIQQELADMRLIAQRVLLRPVPTVADPMRIAVSYTSAASAAQIGGDLYAVVRSSAATRVLIGNARGKGLERWRRLPSSSGRSARGTGRGEADRCRRPARACPPPRWAPPPAATSPATRSWRSSKNCDYADCLTDAALAGHQPDSEGGITTGTVRGRE